MEYSESAEPPLFSHEILNKASCAAVFIDDDPFEPRTWKSVLAHVCPHAVCIGLHTVDEVLSLRKEISEIPRGMIHFVVADQFNDGPENMYNTSNILLTTQFPHLPLFELCRNAVNFGYQAAAQVEGTKFNPDSFLGKVWGHYQLERLTQLLGVGYNEIMDRYDCQDTEIKRKILHGITHRFHGKEPDSRTSQADIDRKKGALSVGQRRGIQGF